MYLKEHRRTGAGAAGVASVPVDDLRPSVDNVEITLDAVFDIRLCENLFDKWMIELDKCVTNLFSWPRVPSNDNMTILGLQSHERLQEARQTRANAEIISWALEGAGRIVLERNGRHSQIPRPVRVSDGPAD